MSKEHLSVVDVGTLYEKFEELVDTASQENEIVITREDQPMAKRERTLRDCSCDHRNRDEMSRFLILIRVDQRSSAASTLTSAELKARS